MITKSERQREFYRDPEAAKYGSFETWYKNKYPDEAQAWLGGGRKDDFKYEAPVNPSDPFDASKWMKPAARENTDTLPDEIIRAIADSETRRSMMGRTRKSTFTSNPILRSMGG